MPASPETSSTAPQRLPHPQPLSLWGWLTERRPPPGTLQDPHAPGGCRSFVPKRVEGRVLVNAGGGERGAWRGRSAPASPALPSRDWRPWLDRVIAGNLGQKNKNKNKNAGPGRDQVGIWALNIQKRYLQGERGVTEGAH